MTKRIVQWVSPNGRNVMASAEQPAMGWTLLHPHPSPYPAFIRFDLTGSKRERVLDAADAMGLSVTHHHAGASFDVIVPTPMHAYELGRRCSWRGLLPKDEV